MTFPSNCKPYTPLSVSKVSINGDPYQSIFRKSGFRLRVYYSSLVTCSNCVTFVGNKNIISENSEIMFS